MCPRASHPVPDAGDVAHIASPSGTMRRRSTKLRRAAQRNSPSRVATLQDRCPRWTGGNCPNSGPGLLSALERSAPLPYAYLPTRCSGAAEKRVPGMLRTEERHASYLFKRAVSRGCGQWTEVAVAHKNNLPGQVFRETPGGVCASGLTVRLAAETTRCRTPIQGTFCWMLRRVGRRADQRMANGQLRVDPPGRDKHAAGMRRHRVNGLQWCSVQRAVCTKPSREVLLPSLSHTR
ncbi:hypothetical protein PMIN01_03000 [Paraphaeosphaeria minitans]|uniref:Uncharacterized protein n=1 Tax=Paraphaeosphaeria minitans TaxID=565426 RepID=A0A9P6KVH8_9PLEO|nr:hypothetical protein PMIN01_03000 [Paraphaeosphaeria minitans]